MSIIRFVFFLLFVLTSLQIFAQENKSKVKTEINEVNNVLKIINRYNEDRSIGTKNKNGDYQSKGQEDCSDCLHVDVPSHSPHSKKFMMFSSCIQSLCSDHYEFDFDPDLGPTKKYPRRTFSSMIENKMKRGPSSNDKRKDQELEKNLKELFKQKELFYRRLTSTPQIAHTMKEIIDPDFKKSIKSTESAKRRVATVFLNEMWELTKYEYNYEIGKMEASEKLPTKFKKWAQKYLEDNPQKKRDFQQYTELVKIVERYKRDYNYTTKITDFLPQYQAFKLAKLKGLFKTNDMKEIAYQTGKAKKEFMERNRARDAASFPEVKLEDMGLLFSEEIHDDFPDKLISASKQDKLFMSTQDLNRLYITMIETAMDHIYERSIKDDKYYKYVHDAYFKDETFSVEDVVKGLERYKRDLDIDGEEDKTLNECMGLNQKYKRFFVESPNKRKIIKDTLDIMHNALDAIVSDQTAQNRDFKNYLKSAPIIMNSNAYGENPIDQLNNEVQKLTEKYSDYVDLLYPSIGKNAGKLADKITQFDFMDYFYADVYYKYGAFADEDRITQVHKNGDGNKESINHFHKIRKMCREIKETLDFTIDGNRLPGTIHIGEAVLYGTDEQVKSHVIHQFGKLIYDAFNEKLNFSETSRRDFNYANVCYAETAGFNVNSRELFADDILYNVRQKESIKYLCRTPDEMYAAGEYWYLNPLLPAGVDKKKGQSYVISSDINPLFRLFYRIASTGASSHYSACSNFIPRDPNAQRELMRKYYEYNDVHNNRTCYEADKTDEKNRKKNRKKLEDLTLYTSIKL